MNRVQKLIVAAVVAAGSVGLVASYHASSPAAVAAPGDRVRPGDAGERDPGLHIAKRNLREAKVALEKSEKEFKGHRKAALKLVEQAIEQVEKALAVPNE